MRPRGAVEGAAWGAPTSPRASVVRRTGVAHVRRRPATQLQPQACFSIGTYLANYDSQQTAVINDILRAAGRNIRQPHGRRVSRSREYLRHPQSAHQCQRYGPQPVHGDDHVADWRWFLPPCFLMPCRTSSNPVCVSSGTTESDGRRAGPFSARGRPYQRARVTSSSVPSSPSTDRRADLRATPATPPTYAQLSTGINVLQALTTAAEMANGTSGITVNLTGALGLTGFTRRQSGSPGRQTRPIAYGPSARRHTNSWLSSPSGTATCATTAQITGTLTVVSVSTAGSPYPSLRRPGPRPSTSPPARRIT